MKSASGDTFVVIINSVTVKCGRQGLAGQTYGQKHRQTRAEADTEKRSLYITMLVQAMKIVTLLFIILL